LSHHYATFIQNVSITIDGIDDESAWNTSNVYEYVIPMANNNVTATKFFISYMYMKYIYDDNNLYIRAIWNDTSLDMKDMFMFCWDINCANYTVAMLAQLDAMRAMAPGEKVDSWKWVSDFRANGSLGKMLDSSFGYDGWYPSESSDVNYGYTYGTWRNSSSNYYQLEMRRPLVPNNLTDDATFVENKPIRFATAVANGYENQDHLISWTYDLNLTHNPLPDSYIPHSKLTENNTTEEGSINSYPYMGIIFVSGLITMILVVRYNNKRKW
jgi:hypothetical protein